MATATRFAILEHDHPILHWDLMLEADGVLRTWRLPSPPQTGEVVAEAIADHRLTYLDYEGPISGNRGTVKCWDRGVYQIIRETNDSFEASIEGVLVRGELHLSRKGDHWFAKWTLTNM